MTEEEITTIYIEALETVKEYGFTEAEEELKSLKPTSRIIHVKSENGKWIERIDGDLSKWRWDLKHKPSEFRSILYDTLDYLYGVFKEE